MVHNTNYWSVAKVKKKITPFLFFPFSESENLVKPLAVNQWYPTASHGNSCMALL